MIHRDLTLGRLGARAARAARFLDAGYVEVRRLEENFEK